jgi:8-oxo-dGTP pyrophosphatase MutT (NUDIX family)
MSDSEVTPLTPLTFNFAVDPAAKTYGLPCDEFIKTYSEKFKFKFKHAAVGAVVIDNSKPERVLLIQRSARDTIPGKWETAGGSMEKTDLSILHGVARELLEETGLIASRLGPPVGEGYYFLTRSGQLVYKFNFLVEVHRDENGQLNVVLEPEEHQSYVWATETEVKARKVGDIELSITSVEQEKVILEAFRTRENVNSSNVAC